MRLPGSAVRILGIDTATRAGGVALLETSDSAAGATVLAEVAHDEDLRHAETILPAVDACLARAGISLEHVDGYAVSIGPGSFTGLRVGLATAKGLAFATGAWVVGVPTLEAYAHATLRVGPGGDGAPRTEAPIAVCLDARKGEVYCALFAVSDSSGGPAVRRVLDDAVEKPACAVERLRIALAKAEGRSSTLRVVGDGAARYRQEFLAALEEHVCVEAVPPRALGRGAAVAEIGLERFTRYGPADGARLGPAYLRASEAELKLRERRRHGSDSH